jgi:hypothetical protein
MAGLFLKDPQELFVDGVLGKYSALPKGRKLHRFTQKVWSDGRIRGRTIEQKSWNHN